MQEELITKIHINTRDRLFEERQELVALLFFWGGYETEKYFCTRRIKPSASLYVIILRYSKPQDRLPACRLYALHYITNMKKPLKYGLITCGIIAIFAGGYWYQQPRVNEDLSNAAAPAPSGNGGGKRTLNVNARIIRPQLLTDEYVTTGLILPDEEVALSFETSGKIVEISFTEGTAVHRGQLLAKVNDKPLQAQLKRLEAQLDLARNRVYRQEQLLMKDAASQEAYEEAKTNLATLEAEIEGVKVNIGLTELRAPFDGVIGLRQVSVGAYANPSTVVAQLTKISPLKVEFSVPERYATQIRRGVNMDFTVEGHQHPFHAQVYAVESSVNRDQHVFTARGLYANSDHRLLPGQYASILLKKEEIPDAMVIPSEAIVPEMGIDKVFCYRSGKAMPVEITAGIRTAGEVQVLSGLQIGDTIITSGTLQLRMGLSVTLDEIE